MVEMNNHSGRAVLPMPRRSGLTIRHQLSGTSPGRDQQTGKGQRLVHHRRSFQFGGPGLLRTGLRRSPGTDAFRSAIGLTLLHVGRRANLVSPVVFKNQITYV